MTTFATPAPTQDAPAKPTPKWLEARRAEQAAARSRAAVEQPCPDCGAPTWYGQGEDHLDARVRVDPAIPDARRTLEVVAAALAGRGVYCRLYGALSRLDRMALGVDSGQLVLRLVREPLGPPWPLHVEHRCTPP